MRQRHLVTVFLVLCALALPLGSASALAATPARTPLDLPAALLVPSDTGHQAYKATDSWSDSADSLAAQTQEASLGTGLKAAGFVRRYSQGLAIPATDDPTKMGDAIITSFLEIYRTAGGAAQGIALEAKLDASRSVVPNQKRVGDQSLVLRGQLANPDTGAPMQNLELVARVGNLVAGVDLNRGAGQQPRTADAYAFMALLLRRIAAGGGPGLSQKVIHLTAPAENWQDGYLRRGSKDLSFMAASDTPAAVKRTDRFFGDATTIYTIEQAFGSDTASTEILVRLASYPSAADTAGILSRTRTYLADEGRTAIKAAPGVKRIGDASTAFVFTVGDAKSIRRHGALLVFRTGTTAVLIWVFSTAAPTSQAINTLAQSEAACLKGPAKACGPLPVLSDLAGS